MEPDFSQFPQDGPDQESKETSHSRTTVAASVCPVRDAAASGQGAVAEVPESQSALLLYRR